MGRKGPPPTPTAVLKTRGSRLVKKRRTEPEAIGGAPSCPEWLDATAKRCWRQLVIDLDALGVMSRSDRNAMARYCVAWSRYRAAYDWIKEHGETYEATGRDGTITRRYPQTDVIKACVSELHRLDIEFGLTAAARARLSTGEAEPKDDMLDLIQRHYGTKDN